MPLPCQLTDADDGNAAVRLSSILGALVLLTVACSGPPETRPSRPAPVQTIQSLPSPTVAFDAEAVATLGDLQAAINTQDTKFVALLVLPTCSCLAILQSVALLADPSVNASPIFLPSVASTMLKGDGVSIVARIDVTAPGRKLLAPGNYELVFAKSPNGAYKLSSLTETAG